MRYVYPDWKAEVETLLALSIPWQDNELLWELYDIGFSPSIVASIFAGECGLIRSGYRGIIQGVYSKDDVAHHRRLAG